MNRTYQGLYWSFIFRFARKERVAGVVFGTLLHEHPRTELVAKTRAALQLLAEFDPRHLARLRRLVAGVFIFEETGPRGEWKRDPRLIRLNERYVASPETTDADVAATIVHETTHAWLEARGFAYRADRRRRIEAICCRAEAAFARRLPDGSSLARRSERTAEGVLAQSDDEWSDAAFFARFLTRLRALNAPEWLVEWVARRKARRAA